MKQIPLRKFQQNASEYIGELPIILTRYNKPFAILSYLKDEIQTHPPVLQKETPQNLVDKKPSSLEVDNSHEKRTGFCGSGLNTHNKGDTFELHEVRYDDIDGNERFRDGFCEKCVNGFKVKVKNQGGTLYLEGIKWDN